LKLNRWGAFLPQVPTTRGHRLHPDGLFFGGADPRAAFAIVRDSENLPTDDFIALDRRDSLADALAPKAAAK
jgi:hypothetical protein